MMERIKTDLVIIDQTLQSTRVYTPVESEIYSERSVVVITGRCQRLNPGSSPGARTKYSHKPK